MPENNTVILDFFLLGFRNLSFYKWILFALLLVVYVVSLSGNLLIVTLVSLSRILQSPMYFFLSHLSFCDIIFTTTILPNMLSIILHEGSRVSIAGCIVQYHIFGLCASTESFLLTTMSYDRYLAICHPLRYTAIMNVTLQTLLVISSWLLSLIVTLVSLVLICSLQFCGSNIIDHFFCDVAPILQLSCSDTSIVKLEIYVCSVPIVLFPFLFITGSYISIFLNIIQISSTTGRQKAFSTCSSHLIVVCLYYGTLFAVYVVPTNFSSLNINKSLSLLYTVITPLFNPIVYTLRNQDIKSVLESYIYGNQKRY
ncbi:PREDICTED: olfactory receptor 998-like [Nanorana parkeri]|uniref:olfactory receptor 998-like n=1 Tax=Nanorana parkeri TaxID=125878 RepID=UPI000854B82F|nr:PREDICTED: olfactory receptor 998-like [Nanorana parkeri]